MSESQLRPDLNVILIDPDDESETPIGRFHVAADGRLSVAAAEADYEEGLRTFAAEINARDELLVKRPPPESAERSELYAQVFQRSSPDFVEGLQEYALQSYGLQLVTDEALEEELAASEDDLEL
jgi:hypothetical protein